MAAQHATTKYVIIGTSPFHDVSIGVGPLSSYRAALSRVPDLEHKGYVTEIVELTAPTDVDTLGYVTNEEGA